jgi:hypothetical protein
MDCLINLIKLPFGHNTTSELAERRWGHVTGKSHGLVFGFSEKENKWSHQLNYPANSVLSFLHPFTNSTRLSFTLLEITMLIHVLFSHSHNFASF